METGINSILFLNHQNLYEKTVVAIGLILLTIWSCTNSDSGITEQRLYVRVAESKNANAIKSADTAIYNINKALKEVEALKPKGCDCDCAASPQPAFVDTANNEYPQ